MFGGLTFLLNGHILVGCKKDGGILISVGKDNHEAAKARPGTSEMIHSDRVMSGFFWIDSDAIEDDEALEDWVRFAEKAVAQRPIKPEKLRRRVRAGTPAWWCASGRAPGCAPAAGSALRAGFPAPGRPAAPAPTGCWTRRPW